MAGKVMAGKGKPITTAIRCAFCKGSGKDPFGLLSHLSTCCVCGGTGTVSVGSPYVTCAFCGGSAVYPRTRLTCTACRGLGSTPTVRRNRPCPRCGGSGVDPHSGNGFYCLACHGAGAVAEAQQPHGKGRPGQ